MKISSVLVFVLSFLITKNGLAHQDYFDLIDQHPSTLGPYGDSDQGEIEIILNEEKIFEIEKSTSRKVGIIAEDRYWIWLNDAVRFPNGTYGVYGRILGRSSLKGIPGVAIMPVSYDGKIGLNLNFRHATRSWEYELPRGSLELDESMEEAALREMKEETGCIASELFFLGYMYPDTGLTNALVPVFLAKTSEQQEANPENSEAILTTQFFSIDEIKEGFLQGYLLAEIHGKQHQVNLRDPFLSFALLQGILQNFFLEN